MKQTHPEVLALCGGFQPSLRSVQQPKKPAQENPIHTADGVILPEFVKRTLRQGPKYAIEPRLTAPKLLSLVRKVAGLAPDSEKERCISEGVDVLHRFKPKRRQLPIRKVVTYLIESGLCIIPSDKEGDALPLPANRRAAAPGLASTGFRSLSRAARATRQIGLRFPFTRDATHGPRLREQAPFFGNKAVRTQQPSGVVLPKENPTTPQRNTGDEAGVVKRAQL
ncbi:hypothetical protein HPB52_002776 [Rhipicephalus sanguineus]|uniref:Uncharacterized protein n=1 Tax=Rhipicephalus sanguineus TaxID=34632 RepID=A0A9D4T791_RHISA|nr:hypothetical protein HPB52_002776 [Rhipicephalus sanguineus]